MVKKLLALPAPLARWLRQEAARRSISASELVRQLLYRGWLANQDGVRQGSQRRRRGPPKPAKAEQWFPTTEAPRRLAMTPEALRARCQRHAKRENGMIIARLGLCTAAKFGTSWRFRFNTQQASRKENS